jgi:hypothetical protein
LDEKILDDVGAVININPPAWPFSATIRSTVAALGFRGAVRIKTGHFYNQNDVPILVAAFINANHSNGCTAVTDACRCHSKFNHDPQKLFRSDPLPFTLKPRPPDFGGTAAPAQFCRIACNDTE